MVDVQTKISLISWGFSEILAKIQDKRPILEGYPSPHASGNPGSAPNVLFWFSNRELHLGLFGTVDITDDKSILFQ